MTSQPSEVPNDRCQYVVEDCLDRGAQYRDFSQDVDKGQIYRANLDPVARHRSFKASTTVEITRDKGVTNGKKDPQWFRHTAVVAERTESVSLFQVRKRRDREFGPLATTA